MDEVSIILQKYSETEKKLIKIYRIFVNRWNINKNDKMHLLFFYIDAYLRHTPDAFITFKNFEILAKNYIKLFINKDDAINFLNIFNNNYFCSVTAQKKLYENNQMKLTKNINFITLLYDANDNTSKLEYNVNNVIDFLIQHENLFENIDDEEDNVLIDFKHNIDTVTEKFKHLNLFDR